MIPITKLAHGPWQGVQQYKHMNVINYDINYVALMIGYNCQYISIVLCSITNSYHFFSVRRYRCKMIIFMQFSILYGCYHLKCTNCTIIYFRSFISPIIYTYDGIDLALGCLKFTNLWWWKFSRSSQNTLYIIMSFVRACIEHVISWSLFLIYLYFGYW